MLPPALVSAYPFLGELSAASRRLIASEGVLRTLRRGAVVIRRGDPVGGMFFVLSGRLRVHTVSTDGNEVALYFVSTGESCLLATSALFAAQPYPAWVDVQSRELKLFALPASAYRQLHETEPVVRDFTVRVLAHRVFDLMRAIEEITLEPLGARLFRFLVAHADAAGRVELTHQQIAGSLGTAREVVSRQLKKLARAGRLETQRGGVRLLGELPSGEPPRI